MKYNLYFSLFVYEQIDYWVPLMRYFLLKSENIEIHCWNEEKAIVEETKSIIKGNFEIFSANNLTIFKGNITPEVVDYLLCHNVDAERKIKWFSIFLSKNAMTIFHSEHWGRELFAPNVISTRIAK